MKIMTHHDKLLRSILILEDKQANDEVLLKDQLKITFENFKPSKLIKKTLDDLISMPDFNDNIIDTSLGLVTGYVSKKLVIGSSHNVFKQIFGGLIQLGVTNLVSNNADQIKAFAKDKMNTFFAKKEEQDS